MGEIFMPKMGDAMTEGKVVRWYKKSGDPVKKGEPVLEIETDKVNLDLESEEDGVLDEIKVQEGATVPVGATLATTRGDGSEGERAKGREGERAGEREGEKKKEKKQEKVEAEQEPVGQQRQQKPEQKAEQKPEQKAEQKAEQKPEQKAPQPQQRPHLRAVEPPPPQEPARQTSQRAAVRSSPLARKMAKEMGVDLSSVRGSGPAGRIIAADIEGAATTPTRKGAVPTQEGARSVPLETKTVPLSAMRRTIAKRLVESIGPIPHFYLTIDVDVTNLLALRTQLNEVEEIKTSVNDFIIRAAALALRHHPDVNASFAGDAIQQHGEIHIGIAVATPEGLITPVVRNTDTKSIPDIAREVKDLAERAKNRRLKPDEYQGSTFTISNLGMYGVEEFSAIINPPNSAILAIGVASPQAVVVEREVVIRDRMKVTMSCDHRVVDGVAGAQYLQTLRQYLEQPIRLVL